MSNPNLKIKMKFFPLTNGKLMQAALIDHCGTRFNVVPNSANIAEISLLVPMPSSVVLEFSGKDHNHDTVVDANNNILEDLHIEILEIGLDCFIMSPHYLAQRIQLNTVDGKVIHSTYIGFNGKMPIDLNKNSVFQQIMLWTAI